MTARTAVAGGTDDPGIQAAAAGALALITDGTRVGLGSGRAASAFIMRLGARVREGLQVSAVPTSSASARLAREIGIPLLDLGEEWDLDLTVDGADEVALNLMSENGNLTLNCAMPAWTGGGLVPGDLADAIRTIPGVVDVGFFLGTAERILVGYPDGRVETLLRQGE
ncbi:MAG: ribose-5-phosphate isomerase A [Gemmatimonadales bacterium]